jgi:hypothetical protein
MEPSEAWDRVCVEFYLQKAENSRVNDTADLGREEYHGDLTTRPEIDPPGSLDAE